MLFRESHILFRECDFVFVSAEEFVLRVYTDRSAMRDISKKFRSDLARGEPPSFVIKHDGSFLKPGEGSNTFLGEFCFGGQMSIA